MRLADHRAGVIASTIVNIHGDGKKTFHPKDFFPTLDTEEREPLQPSGDELLNKFLTRFPRKKGAVN